MVFVDLTLPDGAVDESAEALPGEPMNDPAAEPEAEPADELVAEPADEPADEPLEVAADAEVSNGAHEMAVRYSEANKIRLRAARNQKKQAVANENLQMLISSDSDSDSSIVVQDIAPKNGRNSRLPVKLHLEPLRRHRDITTPTNYRRSPQPGPSRYVPHSDPNHARRRRSTPDRDLSPDDFHWERLRSSDHHRGRQDRHYSPPDHRSASASCERSRSRVSQHHRDLSTPASYKRSPQPGPSYCDSPRTLRASATPHSAHSAEDSYWDQPRSSSHQRSQQDRHFTPPGQQERDAGRIRHTRRHSFTSVDSEISINQQPDTPGQTAYATITLPLQLLDPSMQRSLQAKLPGANTTENTPIVSPNPTPQLAPEPQVTPAPQIVPMQQVAPTPQMVPMQQVTPAPQIVPMQQVAPTPTMFSIPQAAPTPQMFPIPQVVSIPQMLPMSQVCPPPHEWPNSTAGRAPIVVPGPIMSMGQYYSSLQSQSNKAQAGSCSDPDPAYSNNGYHPPCYMPQSPRMPQNWTNSQITPPSYNTEFNYLFNQGRTSSASQSSWATDDTISLSELARKSFAASHQSERNFSQRGFFEQRPAGIQWEMPPPPSTPPRPPRDRLSSVLMPPPSRPQNHNYECRVCGKLCKSFSGLRTHLRMKCEKDTYMNYNSYHSKMKRNH